MAVKLKSELLDPKQEKSPTFGNFNFFKALLNIFPSLAKAKPGFKMCKTVSNLLKSSEYNEYAVDIGANGIFENKHANDFYVIFGILSFY